MNRILFAELKDLKFKCKSNGCDEIFEYEAALKHINSCQKTIISCKQGCGLGICRSDQYFHFENQCSETKKKCKDCPTLLFINRASSKHDCILALKLSLSESQKELSKLKKQILENDKENQQIQIQLRLLEYETQQIVCDDIQSECSRGCFIKKRLQKVLNKHKVDPQ